MDVIPGDWIITDTQGENYPCKDEIFRATYKEVEKCMKEHIRQINEKKELDLKVASLQRYVTESPEFDSISATEQADLTEQLSFMKQYSIFLGRILIELSSPNV